MYGEISEVIVSPPESWENSGGLLLPGTGEHGVGQSSCPWKPFSPAENAPAPCGSSGRHGGRCGEFCPPCVTWRGVKGPADGGLALVKVCTTSEGCAHACRGSCSRGSRRSWQHSGESCIRRVCTVQRRFAQGWNSAGNSGTVAGVGGWGSGHTRCAAWRLTAALHGGVVGIKCVYE